MKCEVYVHNEKQTVSQFFPFYFFPTTFQFSDLQQTKLDEEKIMGLSNINKNASYCRSLTKGLQPKLSTIQRYPRLNQIPVSKLEGCHAPPFGGNLTTQHLSELTSAEWSQVIQAEPADNKSPSASCTPAGEWLAAVLTVCCGLST